MHDRQAEQEQGTQAQGWVARLPCSSSTCSLNGKLGKGPRISGSWTEKSTEESGATTGELGATTGGSGTITKGICASSGKISKTEKEDREARK